MLMYLSSMLTGGHDAMKLPVVLVGGGGGQIKGGRMLDYLDKPNRQMCRLYLSMMDKMGVRLGLLRRCRPAPGGDLTCSPPAALCHSRAGRYWQRSPCCP